MNIRNFLCGSEDEVEGRFGGEDMFRLLDNIIANGLCNFL
jgi:hypothetical protein